MIKSPLSPILLSIAILLLGCKPSRDSANPSPTTDSASIAEPPSTVDASTASEANSHGYSASEHAWFGFADSTGSRLICFGPDTLPPGPYFLASLGGSPVPLEYVEHRRQSPAWDNRDVMNSFEELGGHLFREPTRSLVPNHTYLVVSKDFLDTRHLLRASAGKCRELEQAAAAAAVHDKNRRVRKGWRLADLDSGSISAVHFDGAPPLAALVVSGKPGPIAEHYAGDASGDSTSVWRVDDGGVFDGCSLEILAVFSSANGLEIARTWAGAESEDDVLLRQSTDTFATVVNSSRYWSPM